ncbi:MAG: phage holin family protein [Betaproteobacteria bacterium]|nr:phage holin family protein [Betaproteobacteria bacterium]MBI2509580.1 phage holin family protein [Betaproteobacteria bacterium]
MEEGAPAGQAPGLLQSLRNLLATLVALLQTRLDLLATELEEERLRIGQALLWGCIALAFLVLGVVMLTFFLVVLFWDTHRVLVSGLLAFIYLAAGVTAVLVARDRLRARSKLFSDSLAELAKDREQLTSR